MNEKTKNEPPTPYPSGAWDRSTYVTEYAKLEARESILVDALAEIKATVEGTSHQPVSDIISGCIKELYELSNTTP